MSNTELGFSAVLAALIALPAIAKLSAEALDWLFLKLRPRKSGESRSRTVSM
jgi:hypothetical protein